MVMGEANVSTAGGADLEHANNIAREMVYRCGFRCGRCTEGATLFRAQVQSCKALRLSCTHLSCWLQLPRCQVNP